MPEAQTYIITVPTTTVAVGVRGGGSSNNGDVFIPVPVISPIPIQVAGLVPMLPCDASDCRALTGNCCDSLLVFGNTQLSPIAPYTLQAVGTSTYENDLNDFLFDVQLAFTTVSWTIEKCITVANVDTTVGWHNVATISNQNYGTYQALGTISGHSTYTGFTVNWGKVFFAFGIGNYRIKFSYTSLGTSYSGCFVSPCFVLRKWNCRVATRTVKFEIIMPSSIGKCDDRGYVFNLCNLNWFSSIRIGGVFSQKTFPKYDKLFNKWQNGKEEQVHSEAIKKWKFSSLLLSNEYHDRLGVYMMQANSTKVSDYNIFAVDHEIKQKLIAHQEGGYDIVEYSTSLPPRSIASAEFGSGIQNLFASNCCNLK